ncbi:RrF2 family transcriptional regulator [Candidatus Omnitrophota bacterium]
MKITTQGVYGLVCVLSIAQARNKRPISMQEISQQEQLPIDYIEQLLLKLRRSGIVKSVRGRTGGYKLSKSATRISVKDIVEAVEGGVFEAICLGPKQKLDKCSRAKNCLAGSVWVGLKNRVEEYLEGITIADLLNYPSPKRL